MLKAKVEAPDDLNPQETSEWVEALDEIIDEAGPDRASYLLERLMERAANLGVQVAAALEYSLHQYHSAGRGSRLSRRPRDRAADQEPGPLERHRHGGARQQVRRQHRRPPGHLRVARDAARSRLQPFLPRLVSGRGRAAGDFVYFQGHASPGVYARAFLEGRLSEQHLENFRHELRDHPGLSSYPHPWLMPDFWQFPTVSMGLGPISAIYQARFMRYLENRGIIPRLAAQSVGVPGRRRNAMSRNRWAR